MDAVFEDGKIEFTGSFLNGGYLSVIYATNIVPFAIQTEDEVVFNRILACLNYCQGMSTGELEFQKDL